jgi:uncharacterized protein YigA (DUF484 family)
MSAQAVLAAAVSYEEVLRGVQTRVTTDFDISHATIQVEPDGHESAKRTSHGTVFRAARTCEPP